MSLLVLNIVTQVVVKDSLWETILKYISLLFSGWQLGEIYIICTGLLVVSYYLFGSYKQYLKILVVSYVVLLIFYFYSIHYYYQDIRGWVNEGHSNPLEFDEVFFSGLDTSVFFLIFNLIFIIILLIQLKKKSKGT